MDETFSSIDLITQCLTDTERTLKFKQAIEEAVKPGDVVLEAGTGSSILSLFAARAGAKKVMAVEIDPYVAKLAQQNVINNGLEDIIQVVVDDVRNVKLEGSKAFDAVIMELLTTGMVDEYQVWTANNLHERGLVDESTVFIPKRQDTFVTLSQMNFVEYGLTMRMVMHLWEPFPREEFLSLLSESTLLNSVPFNKKHSLDFSWVGVFDVDTPGTLNSVYLTSKTILNDSLDVGDTLALNAPVVVPLENDHVVQKGDRVECSIEYKFGGGYRNFKADVRVL